MAACQTRSLGARFPDYAVLAAVGALLAYGTLAAFKRMDLR